MPERPPVWLWTCCQCYRVNSVDADPSCAYCSNHWRCRLCIVWEDNCPKSESRRVNSQVSQPSTTIPPSASSSSPRPVSDRRPVIIQLAPPKGQQSPATTAPVAGTSSAINHDGKSLRGDLVSDTPEQGEGGSDARKLSRATSIYHPLQPKAKQQRSEISRVCTDESKSKKSSLSGASSEQTRGRQDMLWSTKSLNPPTKTTTKSKRGILVTQDRPKPQKRVAFSIDDARNDDLPASQERSEDKRKNTTDSLSAQHGNHDQDPKHIQREAKRPLTNNLVRSRSPSPRSDVAVSGRSDAGSLSNRNVIDLVAGKEIGFRIDATAPFTLEFYGDMEGRTMQLIPTEDGMTELVISSGRDSDSEHPDRHRTYVKRPVANPARNRRLPNSSPAVKTNHYQDHHHTEQAKQAAQERERKNRNSTMASNRPTVWDYSSESEFEEDVLPGISQAPLLLRRRPTNVDSRKGKERVAQKARQPPPPPREAFQREMARMTQTLEAPKREQMAKQLATLTEPTGTPSITARSPQAPQQPTALAESATIRKPTHVESPRPEYTAAAVKYSLQSSNTLDTSGLKNPGLLTNMSQVLAFESLDMLSDALRVSVKDPFFDRGTHEGDLGSINPISEPENGAMLPENAFNQDFRAPEELAESLISPCAPAFGDAAVDVNMVDTVGLELPSNLSVPGHSTVDTWLNMEVAHSSHGYPDWDYDCSLSGPSSYAASVASVFSVASLASSASVISRGSGYSAVQIATATKVLLAIFYEDESLLSLYKSAIENQNIGPERLQRNLRRLFRAYAGLLEGEATERLEYLASRLVLMKSALLARYIVEKLQNSRVGVQLPRRERNEESSDEDDNSADARPVNEDAFEDLAIFREFLVESEAFRTFRVRLQAFIIPRSTHLTHPEPASNGDVLNAKIVEPIPIKAVAGYRKALTWQKWRNDSKQSVDGFFCGAYGKTTASNVFHLMADAFMLATDDILIAAGLLELPLRPDMVRLRWRCACGESLHDDVAELRKGGVIELMDHMQRTSGAKVCASPHSHQSGNQQYIVPHPFQWIRKTVTMALGCSKKSSACLPQHNTACTVNATTTNPSSAHTILHLLACMHRNRLRKVLQQDRIEDVTTDRTLLCFLRKQYLRHRGRFLHLLSLKSIKGISFVKFRLPIGGSVDVRHHDPCCITNNIGQTTCECIPPLPKVEPSPGAEYRCIPGPPATYPPIPPVYLASLFACPTDVHEKDTWILDQLPKRTCGELQGQIGQPAEGWGIYYDEGLDRDMLALTILVVFFVASLLFGILWSRFQYDVQGAFGVSAYMIACCAVLLPVIVTRLENKG